MIQHYPETLTRRPSLARCTSLRVLAAVFGSVVMAVTPSPSHSGVLFDAIPTIGPDDWVSWELSSWEYVYSRSNDCGPSSGPICSPSSVTWDVDDGSQMLTATLMVPGVCWSAEGESQVAAAMDALSSAARSGRRVPSNYQPMTHISATLVSCDRKKYVYAENRNTNRPPVFPLSCTITGPNSLSYEIENGTETKNVGAAVTCTGSGRASAKVSVEGPSSEKPVKGLTVSTKVVSNKIDVQAGYSSPIDITVTVTALNPEPGIYQSTFVYVLDII